MHQCMEQRTWTRPGFIGSVQPRKNATRMLNEIRWNGERFQFPLHAALRPVNRQLNVLIIKPDPIGPKEGFRR